MQHETCRVSESLFKEKRKYSFRLMKKNRIYNGPSTNNFSSVMKLEFTSPPVYHLSSSELIESFVLSFQTLAYAAIAAKFHAALFCIRMLRMVDKCCTILQRLYTSLLKQERSTEDRLRRKSSRVHISMNITSHSCKRERAVVLNCRPQGEMSG